MKSRIMLPLLLLVASCLLGACSGDSSSDETVGSASAAISLPSLMPVPNNWQGSTVDLMVADALASCAWKNDTTVLDTGVTKDNYLSTVIGFMQTAYCGTYADPNTNKVFGHWFLQRADANCNTAASAGAPATIALQKHKIPQEVIAGTTVGVPSGVSSYAIDAANAILRAPSLNLCVAQQLRSQAPGTAGGEALLLSASEQRFLLEATRERAQAAMLGFAQLAVTFTEQDYNPNPLNTNISYNSPLPIVIRWGRDPASGTASGTTPSILENMGRDFAVAVQLHAIVSQELAEMFGRSASAGEPRGGHAKTAAEETWSSGSWRQRSLASLFGGDPLADELDGSAPWANPTGNHYPNVMTGGYSAMSWPSQWEQPYFKANLDRPEVSRLLALARTYDVQDVKQSGSLYGWCVGIDRQATSDRLYRAVEAALRNAQCYQQSGGTCTTVTPTSLPDPSTNYSSFLLWTQHRIMPDHATVAAEYLAELLEPVCGYAGDMLFGSGARDLGQGSIGYAAWATATGDYTWYHVSADAAFVERSPTSIQPMFGRYTHFFMTPQLLQWAIPYYQGFTSAPWYSPTHIDESRRLLGSSAALIATREALLVADQRIANTYYPVPSTIKDTYFVEKSRIFEVINGAVGNVGVTIRPSLTSTASSSNMAQPATVYQSGSSYQWKVDVTMPANHPWWPADGYYYLSVIFDDPIAHTLVTYPQTSVFERTADTVLAASTTGSLGYVAWPSGSTPPANLRSFSGYVWVPAGVKYATFIARRWVAGTYQAAVLAANVPINPSDPAQGFYMSPLGSLNVYADRLTRGLPGNPTKPAYDGFGFPTDWVPPTDPTLFGGFAGEDAASHYLSRAKEAGAEATAAVQIAFDNLMQQASDTAQEQAAQQEASALIQEQQDELCGAGNANCDTSLYLGPIFQNLPSPICPPPNPDDLYNKLDCMTARMLQVAKLDFVIANAVKAHLTDPAVPTFASYSGGKLQSMYTRQWGDAIKLRDAVQDMLDALADTKAHVLAFQSAMANVSTMIALNCGADRMEDATNAGQSNTVGVTANTNFANFGTSVSYSHTWNPGPLIAQKQKCTDALLTQPSQEATLIAGFADSVLALSQHAARVNDAASILAEDGADMQYTAASTERAKAQASLEADLVAQTLTTSFGIYRRYHSYDLWRAKAAIENARRYAVAARRAIEAKYLVDLSEMKAPEAFVAAPASWADQVYDYDLSLPQAVGLSVGTQEAGGIYPNKVLDYVNNLEAFVEGYAVNRPSASAHGDSDVVTLLGPEATLTQAQSDGMGLDSTTQQYAWSFYCPASEQWVGLPTDGPNAGKADLACDGEQPTRARMVFSLDAWGRVNANGVQAPPTVRYNARWDAFTVNLVGTGIKDCTKAADPLVCYSSAFVPYDLSHAGPSWVTDYAGTWRTLGVPMGRIEGAKALAAEQWLDPIANGWSAPYVQAVARSEFAERPLDGTYLLDIEVAPEVQLSHLDRVQILTRTSYWVKQQ